MTDIQPTNQILADVLETNRSLAEVPQRPARERYYRSIIAASYPAPSQGKALTQLRGAPSYAQSLQRANDQLNDAYSLRPASYKQTGTGKGIGLLSGVVGKRTRNRCQVRKQFRTKHQTKYDNIYLDENR